jgi:hypothetical protein
MGHSNTFNETVKRSLASAVHGGAAGVISLGAMGLFTVGGSLLGVGVVGLPVNMLTGAESALKTVAYAGGILGAGLGAALSCRITASLAARTTYEEMHSGITTKPQKAAKAFSFVAGIIGVPTGLIAAGAMLADANLFAGQASCNSNDNVSAAMSQINRTTVQQNVSTISRNTLRLAR